MFKGGFLLKMKALLFAAGRGTRLRPLTDTKPKALVPVAGKPLLWHTIMRLREAGATEIVVNVHHFGEQIIDYLSTHDFDIPILVSDERGKLLDTGGGLRKALPLFSVDDCPILIHNVDILSNAPLRRFYEDNIDADAALMVSNRKTNRYLLFDDMNCLRAWTNLQTGEVKTPFTSLDLTNLKRFAFSGIHLISPRLISYLNEFPEVFPIMDFYLKSCDRLSIRGVFEPSLRLLDVGKRDTLQEAETFLNTLLE